MALSVGILLGRFQFAIGMVFVLAMADVVRDTQTSRTHAGIYQLDPSVAGSLVRLLGEKRVEGETAVPPQKSWSGKF